MLGLALFYTLSAAADDFDSAGVKIHYEIKGQGPPVILIHGLMASAKINWDWPGITPLLTNRHQVIALDCRGHGFSDKPTADGQYGLKMVDDVVRLMDHLKIKQADVVGYSMGGMITMKLMALHPERVRSGVVGGMGWLQQWDPLLGTKDGTNQNAFIACVKGFSELALAEKEVREIKTPFTVLMGERDPLRARTVEPLRQLRPDVPINVIAGANHLTCIGKPEFKAALKNFLNHNTAEASPSPPQEETVGERRPSYALPLQIYCHGAVRMNPCVSVKRYQPV